MNNQEQNSTCTDCGLVPSDIIILSPSEQVFCMWHGQRIPVNFETPQKPAAPTNTKES